MKTYKCKDGALSFNYPDNWMVEQEKNIISAFDAQNGVGALQFSVYQVKNPEILPIKHELEDYIMKRHGTAEVFVNNLFVFSNYLSSDGKRYWKYWLFLTDSELTFVSYNCQQNDIGKEDEIINGIIHSAVLRAVSS